MLTDHERIARQMGDPALVRLHRRLDRLKSVVTFMNTGAHPDDETSGLLAALRYHHGMRIVIGCSTRGEGGQNAIGPERGSELGVLRTRELEEAARVLDASIAWLGHGPNDPVHDFGFSKNGDDTLSRWGEERIIERLVRAYRSERPDIVLPTFLDVPGQHGHHRAMTRATETAVERAADASAFPEHAAAGLRPWRVSKIYLPAWSGASSAYDDELPPPPATTVVHVPTPDPVSGAAYGQIGEWSRSCHRCQGMGVWRDHAPDSWPLHLLTGSSGEQAREDDIRDGLPADIGALAGIGALPRNAAAALLEAQDAIDRARAAFPDRQLIIDRAIAAARAIEAAVAVWPQDSRDLYAHRLTLKLRELDAVVLEASGISVRAWAEPASVAPGAITAIHAVINQDGRATAAPVALDARVRDGIAVTEQSTGKDTAMVLLAVEPGARLTTPYPPAFDPMGGNGDAWLAISTTLEGRTIRGSVDLEMPLRVEPAHSLALDPDVAIINLAVDREPTAIAVTARATPPIPADRLTLDAPDGWRAARAEPDAVADAARFEFHPPAGIAPGLVAMRPKIDGQDAFRTTAITYPHIGRAGYSRPEIFRVLTLDTALPADARIGYVGGGNDRVGLWLGRLGLDVSELDAEILARGDLSRFTTIVVGIFAFGKRADLAQHRSRLHAWVEAGGHLVTLYHRPGDGWDPERTPPRQLEIGSPSLRWRVTDPTAPVTHLTPGHPLLTTPNRITDADWDGWFKERGLYFAARWNPVYSPLLAMNDIGERPLEGALLSGAIGRGRHTHTSLVLHQQLDRLVPGAFRLLANLVQPA